MQRKTKVKRKWRLEYWKDGRKYIKTFGSPKQANQYAESQAPVSSVSITPFLEREGVL